MKKLSLIMAVIIVLTVFASCGKDKDDGAETSGNPAETLNGEGEKQPDVSTYKQNDPEDVWADSSPFPWLPVD